jgi:hypothetical protein
MSKRTFRSGEAAEVHEVAVPAGLDADPRVRRARKVACHEDGSAAEEYKGRFEHPAVSDGQELLHPADVGLPEQVDRVASVGAGLPRSMRRAWHLLADGLSPGNAAPA